ncbi:MAG: hypothetical protein JO261_05380 [Alphaproteobacteria bacterium]|nr:hypothetical protein [Alphaproteobacteria bacterium]MBV9693113.1 hypothetical protein [Alphaproteobacteria bacterium]
MSGAEEQRIERLLAMAERLIAVLEADVALLKSGKARGLKTTDPEIVRLSALYGREAAGLNAQAAKAAQPEMVKRLTEATGRFRALLEIQMRLLARMRAASEGMIHAVAEEIERRRAPLRTYGLSPAARNSGALLYNNVA